MGERARKFYRLVFVFALIEDLLIVNSLDGAKKGEGFLFFVEIIFAITKLKSAKENGKLLI